MNLLFGHPGHHIGIYVWFSEDGRIDIAETDLIPFEFPNGHAGKNPAHPAFKTSIASELMDIFKYPDKAFLQHVLRQVTIAGIPVTEGHHFARVKVKQCFLKFLPVCPATLYEFLFRQPSLINRL
jgi:hypothetical protein